MPLFLWLTTTLIVVTAEIRIANKHNKKFSIIGSIVFTFIFLPFVLFQLVSHYKYL